MVKVFNAPIPEPKLFLQLVQEDSRACLILVDKNGDKVDRGNVLWIDEDGIRFHQGITREAPFRLNDEREINNCDH